VTAPINTDARQPQLIRLPTENATPHRASLPLTGSYIGEAPLLRTICKFFVVLIFPACLAGPASAVQRVGKCRSWHVEGAADRPAGVAARVYAGAEGLNALVVEDIAIGGQAGTSSRIENYMGFPTGISGADLVWRGRCRR